MANHSPGFSNRLFIQKWRSVQRSECLTLKSTFIWILFYFILYYHRSYTLTRMAATQLSSVCYLHHILSGNGLCITVSLSSILNFQLTCVLLLLYNYYVLFPSFSLSLSSSNYRFHHHYIVKWWFIHHHHVLGNMYHHHDEQAKDGGLRCLK